MVAGRSSVVVRGQVVILQPPPMAPLPAFAGDNVKVPMTYGEANYFCRRKITMVNGMHTTLAFLTLCKWDCQSYRNSIGLYHLFINTILAVVKITSFGRQSRQGKSKV